MLNAIFLGLIAVGFVAAQLSPSGIKIQPIALVLGCLGLASALFPSVPLVGWLVGAGAALAFAGLSWQSAAVEPRSLVSAACFGFAAASHVAPSKAGVLQLVASVVAATVAAAVANLVNRRVSSAVWVVPVAAASLVAVQVLSTASDVVQSGTAGPMIAAAVVVIGLILSFVKGKDGARPAWLPLVLGLFLAGVAFATGSYGFGQSDTALTAMVAAIFAGAAAWATSESRSSHLPVGATAAAGLVLANWAFSSGRGMGIAFVGFVAVFVALLSGSVRVAMALLGVTALAWFRVVRFVLPDATTAFDAGNHYAVLGFIIAILGTLSVLDVVKQNSSPVARFCAGLAGAVAIPLLTIYLGMKGAIGLALGLAMAPVIVTLMGSSSVVAAAIGLGGAALMIVSVPWIQPVLEGDRDIRVKWMIALAAVSGVLFVLANAQGLMKPRVAAEVAE